MTVNSPPSATGLNGQVNDIATYPKAITRPGTANGSMPSASSSQPPLILTRTTKYAIARPRMIANTIADSA